MPHNVNAERIIVKMINVYFVSTVGLKWNQEATPKTTQQTTTK